MAEDKKKDSGKGKSSQPSEEEIWGSGVVKGNDGE